MVAHPVDGQTAGLRGCIDNVTARTHTEGVYASSVGTLMGYLIIGRSQGFNLRGTILCNIDVSLGMLNTQTHGKRFLLHGHASLQQLLKGIPRTVPHRQYGDLRLNFIRPVYGDGF